MSWQNNDRGIDSEERLFLLSFLLSLWFPVVSSSVSLLSSLRSVSSLCSLRCIVVFVLCSAVRQAVNCINLQLRSVGSYINALTCCVSIKSRSKEDIHFLSAHILFLLVRGHILLSQRAADLYPTHCCCIQMQSVSSLTTQKSYWIPTTPTGTRFSRALCRWDSTGAELNDKMLLRFGSVVHWLWN